MASQQALQPTPKPTSPTIVEVEKLFEQMKETTQSIARRAYDFFESRGREWGHELEDWLRAEAEMMRRVPVEIQDTEKNLIVRAEVPGFKANEIQISATPRRVILQGKTETASAQKNEQQIYSERCSNQFYRSLDLPTDIDTNNINTTLKDGVLELTLPKIAKREPTHVEINVA